MKILKEELEKYLSERTFVSIHKITENTGETDTIRRVVDESIFEILSKVTYVRLCGIEDGLVKEYIIQSTENENVLELTVSQ